jgi:hypothetical protein
VSCRVVLLCYIKRFIMGIFTGSLSVVVVWDRKLNVLFTYDDYLCSSGGHHALSE